MQILFPIDTMHQNNKFNLFLIVHFHILLWTVSANKYPLLPELYFPPIRGEFYIVSNNISGIWTITIISQRIDFSKVSLKLLLQTLLLLPTILLQGVTIAREILHFRLILLQLGKFKWKKLFFTDKTKKLFQFADSLVILRHLRNWEKLQNIPLN